MTPPSIARRISHALLRSALLWSAAVSLAVWLTVQHEMDELLDDSLQGAAEALRPTLAVPTTGAAEAPRTGPGAVAMASDRFAWQVVAYRAGSTPTVQQASSRAPAQPFSATPGAGFSRQPGWRVFGTAIGADGRMLYVAQSHDEQREASLEVAFNAALATLAVALLSHLWMRQRVAQELQPLQRLSQRLQGHDPRAPQATLGRAERAELAPVQEAIDQLASRLAQRLASERAFSAHAAHALRTPLAGIEAQLAVALREAPAALQPRLQRVQSAAERLRRVVAALLALFRSGSEIQRQAVELQPLLARFPVPGLQLQVAPGAVVEADPDLLSAALFNLLDNASRHGARRVELDLPDRHCLRLRDDGPGVDAARRSALRAGLEADAAQDTDRPGVGLGLAMAQAVARAHGGRIELPATEHGFTVLLRLAPDPSSP